MSKYTKDELKGMAKRAIEARNCGDIRYQELMLVLMMITGLDQSQVERKIDELAA